MNVSASFCFYFYQNLVVCSGQRNHCFGENWITYDNNFILTVLGLVKNRFHPVPTVYGIMSISTSVRQIKSAVVWAKFTESLI